jgi:hypothetical protein
MHDATAAACAAEHTARHSHDLADRACGAHGYPFPNDRDAHAISDAYNRLLAHDNAMA